MIVEVRPAHHADGGSRNVHDDRKNIKTGLPDNENVFMKATLNQDDEHRQEQPFGGPANQVDGRNQDGDSRKDASFHSQDQGLASWRALRRLLLRSAPG